MNTLLTTYLRDISTYQPLTTEQELTLAQSARQGDMRAREQLIEANLLLVVNIAKQNQRPGVDLMDLIQEGNIGLIKAVDMFDPEQGNRLSALARFWVHKQIQRFLEKTYDDTASLDETVASAEELVRLSETIEDQGTILGDPNFRSIERIIELDELKQHITALVDKLSPNEQQVLQLLYGLKGYPCMTREEISKVLYIQTDQISRIKTRALQRLGAKLQRRLPSQASSASPASATS